MRPLVSFQLSFPVLELIEEEAVAVPVSSLKTRDLLWALSIFGVDTSCWGVGENKSATDLLQELIDEESSLRIDQKGLQRWVSVVTAVIRNNLGLTLVEDFILLKNGQRRARTNKLPGGKIKSGELPRQALLRELAEELKLDRKQYSYGLVSQRFERRPSKSYPSLHSVYEIYEFRVDLAADVEIKEGYAVKAKEGELHFAWKRM